MKPGELLVTSPSAPVLYLRQDGRGAPRMVCHLPILADLGTRKIPATILNLSWGGIQLQSPREILPGALVRLLPEMPSFNESSPAWTVCRWSSPRQPNGEYLSGHQFQTGSAAPSRIWVLEMLSQLGKNPACLMESRRHARFSFQTDVMITTGQDRSCKLLNLSQGGACLQADQLLPARDFHLWLPFQGRRLRLRGDIVEARTLPDGTFCHHISWESYIPERAAVRILLTTLRPGERLADET